MDYDKFLGLDTDTKIASKFGVSRSSVTRRRYKLGIKPYGTGNRSILYPTQLRLIPDEPTAKEPVVLGSLTAGDVADLVLFQVHNTIYFRLNQSIHEGDVFVKQLLTVSLHHVKVHELLVTEKMRAGTPVTLVSIPFEVR